MYEFDHHLDAKAATKEKFVWMLYMGIVFFLLYGASNQYAGLTMPHPSLWMTWEKQIPFVEPFIVPYMSSDVMFVIAFFMPYTRLELRILAARVFFIVLFASFVFMLFPLQFSFEKPKVESFTFLFSLLEADLPFNQLPSLHIAFAIVIWSSLEKYLAKKWIKILVAIWLVGICASTLLVYQHHFIDIPTGAILGLLALYLIGEKRSMWLTRHFTTPRSLKMALYYIVASTLFVLMAFATFSLFAWICLWIFLSLFLVSFTYAFGLSVFLAGSEVKASWWQWLLFSPYFLGNYLTWQYYRRKLPLMSPLKDRVYFGRHPSTKEYRVLKAQGIRLVLNLATEQQVQKKGLEERRLAFLDQTIQSPESLHEGVQFVEAHKNDGLYVHCALGLSRSILLASAWLLFCGYSLEETQSEMIKIRPNSVKSPYMHVTLKMYQEYLAELKSDHKEDKFRGKVL